MLAMFVPKITRNKKNGQNALINKGLTKFESCQQKWQHPKMKNIKQSHIQNPLEAFAGIVNDFQL